MADKRQGLKFPRPEKRGPKPRKPIARKKRPAPLRKQGSRGEMRKLADDLMSLYVRHKAEWRCWLENSLLGKCGSKNVWNEMQMAHIIGKGAHPAGRFIEQNVRCLCKRCHRYYTDRPEEWREVLDKKIGEGAFQQLFNMTRVRQGRVDLKLEIFYWLRKLEERDDLDKIQERFDTLKKKAAKLGAAPW